LKSHQSSKICFFNSTKSWGGGEKWHFEMAVFLHNKGFNVVVFANLNSELFRKVSKTEIRVIPVKVGNLSFLNFFKILKLRRIFQLEKINTILMNLSADVKFAGKSAKLAGIKNIVYRRGSAIPIKNTFLNRYIFKNLITDILANSEETKKTINQNNNELFPENKITVIYNGIDLEKYDKTETKQIYQRHGNEVVIGNAGRLEYQKNQKDLIYIAKYLKMQSINFKIVIAGSGRLKNELKQLSVKEHVEEKILFLDFVDNIKSFMESIDIFVLTSFWEGFGYVLVEAMASKKPVVAYKISSNPEIIRENYSGFLIEYPDKEKFAERIKFLYENSEKRKDFGDMGRKIVEDKFQFSKCTEEVEKYLEFLAKKIS
jgi:glycosyltransferase involved in cell wall biosynthesis